MFFKDWYWVIVYDYWGQGQSLVVEGGYDMDMFIRDVVVLFDVLKIDCCYFVGLSMGGFVGLCFVSWYLD